MDQIRCYQCKWWQVTNDEHKIAVYRIKHPSRSELRTCNNPKVHKTYSYPPLDSDEVLVECDEGWCWLMGPDFGCVNGELI